MKTYHRICIKTHTIYAENGSMTVERGKEYLTSDERSDGTCFVFSKYWVPFPLELFAGEKIFTKS